MSENNVLIIHLIIIIDMFFNSLIFDLSFKFCTKEYHE